ncbi:MFS transporter [Phytoactinopolyspora endophytica]|uniref:MFS transporter n=1 Tax=Phytoactinopolyspora endophytica TaxID=1642495 RepID=UPI00101C6F1F|nr:MFS transporter [Phytoactinopolyspora endophytica]
MPPLADVFRSKSGIIAMTAVLLSATAIGATNLAVLQFAESRLSDYAAAASTVGAFGLGNAIGLIIQGRLLDGRRPKLIPISMALIFLAAILVGLFWLPADGRAYAAAFAIAGASVPAITGFVRAQIPRLYAQEVHISAYSVLAVVFQAGLAFGPSLTSGINLTFGSEAPLLAIALIILTTGVLSLSIGRPNPSEERERAALRARGRFTKGGGYATLVMATLAFGFSSGTMIVSIPAILAATHAGPWIGAAFSAMALGSLASGIIYGGKRPEGDLSSHLQKSLLISASIAGILLLTTGHPAAVIATMLLFGAASAPAGITASALLDRVVTRESLATAYTAMIAGNLIAVAAGSAFAGVAIDKFGVQVALPVLPITLSLALVVTFLRRRSIGREATSAPRT